ncbi:ATP-dependent nuclease [Helicobacter muridarum]|uniref:ATP dependent nuclease AddB n=1 Tax=Helicobacter muridarum TaxID=216 RepID=A0A377PW01_9HELI|nr:hypothetical protein [Helicobacter muridarum]TLE00915.1 ATP-dependent nuclease [Helicobacter muridarum]STQ86690.1 ATP dependent nuclease AddB [Helicobacter muridarum]
MRISISLSLIYSFLVSLVFSSHVLAYETEYPDIDQHDLYMIEAANLTIDGKYLEAYRIYENLFIETKDFYFLKQMVLSQSEAGNFDIALNLAMQYQAQSHDIDDDDINAIIAESHMRKGEYHLASILLEKIILTNPNIQFHYILSNIYIQERQLDKALEHLLVIYNDSMNASSKLKNDVLYQIIAIYIDKQDIQNALKYLSDSIVNNESNENLENFIGLYIKLNEFDTLKDSLIKRFENFQNIQNATLFVRLLMQQEKYEESIVFLQENESVLGHEARELLMQVYSAANRFQEAFEVARSLYEDTKINNFLRLSAVYQYEALGSRDKEALMPVIESLKKAIEHRNKDLVDSNSKPSKEDAFFYNFLGYLLIDYDIDLESGIHYVSLALSIEPDSVEYLDSLAWGFYKIKDCKRAQETFDLITDTQIDSSEELQKHREFISQCQ